ncbi:hypothetical protein B0I35DRAFT_215954 [Stachybotrys elegans]|uniref:Uncharacterized protein n=1 Tax=Stachybotrys elegans TaxID=80388 RepID=A0A8K0SX90_9HYPO|nr:hypothetical protein B0I35DRAFT_215954 [Stachybotrys elegans]
MSLGRMHFQLQLQLSPNTSTGRYRASHGPSLSAGCRPWFHGLDAGSCTYRSMSVDLPVNLRRVIEYRTWMGLSRHLHYSCYHINRAPCLDMRRMCHQVPTMAITHADPSSGSLGHPSVLSRGSYLLQPSSGISWGSDNLALHLGCNLGPESQSNHPLLAHVITHAPHLDVSFTRGRSTVPGMRARRLSLVSCGWQMVQFKRQSYRDHAACPLLIDGARLATNTVLSCNFCSHIVPSSPQRLAHR